jgi:endonuclease
MKKEYRQWLEQQKYDPGTTNAQLYRAKRAEDFHGDLDDHYATDRMAGLISQLRYSNDDERHNLPNPSKIPFDGDKRKNLASYRNAVERYKRFRDTAGDVSDLSEIAPVAVSTEDEVGQRIGLERDMQATLRMNIAQLEPGLTVIDDGAERSVDSGFIDITARDAAGTTVVIELKTGLGGQRAVAQILSYMGDVAAEEESEKVRGILVCSEFDAKARAAARMAPTLMLRKYSVKFLFSDGNA